MFSFEKFANSYYWSRYDIFSPRTNNSLFNIKLIALIYTLILQPFIFHKIREQKQISIKRMKIPFLPIAFIIINSFLIGCSVFYLFFYWLFCLIYGFVSSIYIFLCLKKSPSERVNNGVCQDCITRTVRQRLYLYLQRIRRKLWAEKTNLRRMKMSSSFKMRYRLASSCPQFSRGNRYFFFQRKK